MKDQIADYIHGFNRSLTLQGVKANVLSQSPSDPKGIVDVLIQSISGGSGIPVRILTGSERENVSNLLPAKVVSFIREFGLYGSR